MPDKIFYAMADAYHNTRTRPEAVSLVKQENPDISNELLENLWGAIDAYVDVYG